MIEVSHRNVIRAENVVYGIAVDRGRDSGWKIVGSSLLPLPHALEESLVGRTHVGLNRDDQIGGGGVGYFGEVVDRDRRWAVICRYEPSTVAEATGHHFVQRNIVLVPFGAFLADAEGRALDLVDDIPTRGPFNDVQNVTKIGEVSLRINTRHAKPAIPDDVLRPLLRALLQDRPTIITWSAPDLDVLQYLLEFFPPAIRAFVTWCTCVADVGLAKFARVKIVRKVEVEQDATIFLFDRMHFVQQRIDESVAPNLVDALVTAAALGPAVLASLHESVERAVIGMDDYGGILVAADRAAVRWRRRRKIESLSAEEKWGPVLEHAADLMHDESPAAATERRWLLTHAMTSIEPSDADARKNLATLNRQTDFEPDDFEEAGRVVAGRVSGGDVRRFAEFLEAFDVLGNSADIIRAAFFDALPGTLEKSRRTWQFVEQLARQVDGEIPAPFLQQALRDWAFDPKPEWSDIRQLFTRISLYDVRLIAPNAPLCAQIERDACGRFGYVLLRARAAGQPLNHLPAETQNVPAEALLTVLEDGVAPSFEWLPPLLLRAVATLFEKDPASVSRVSEGLGARIIDALSAPGTGPFEEQEKIAIKSATSEIVKRHPKLRSAAEFAGAKREIATAERALRQHVDKAIAALERGAGDPERVLSADGANPLLWWVVMSAWYERDLFDAERVLEQLRKVSAAFATRGARHLLAVAMMAPQWTPREAKTIATCAAALVELSAYAGDAVHGMLLTDERQLDVAIAAITLFRGARALQLSRSELEQSLPLKSQLRSWKATLEALNSRLERLAQEGPVTVVSDAAREAGSGDLRSLQGAVEKLLETITRGRGIRSSDLVRALERGINDLQDLVDQKFLKS